MIEWRDMRTAPRDRPIVVAVAGPDDLGWSFHELPYRLCWYGGRWCYARNKAPVFAWHQPKRWREGELAKSDAVAVAA